MNFNINLENINYIKIVYKDRNGDTHSTKATIKTLGEREIYACTKKEEGISINTPQDIMLSFISNNGIYRTSTTLKYIVFEEPFLYFAMKSPEGMNYEQNREYFRVKSSETVVITYTKDDSICTVSCKSHDISATGIMVELDSEIDFPEDVSLKIIFDDREIKTEAKFIRIGREDDKINAAFSFINLAETSMDFISKKCIQKQIEEKRNKL